MPVREIVGKTVGFGLVAAALIVGGILDLLGGHVYNDYLNTALGIILILMGLATGGLGTFLIVGILYEEQLRRQDEAGARHAARDPARAAAAVGNGRRRQAARGGACR